MLETSMKMLMKRNNVSNDEMNERMNFIRNLKKMSCNEVYPGYDMIFIKYSEDDNFFCLENDIKNRMCNAAMTFSSDEEDTSFKHGYLIVDTIDRIISSKSFPDEILKEIIDANELIFPTLFKTDKSFEELKKSLSRNEKDDYFEKQKEKIDELSKQMLTFDEHIVSICNDIKIFFDEQNELEYKKRKQTKKKKQSKEQKDVKNNEMKLEDLIESNEQIINNSNKSK